MFKSKLLLMFLKSGTTLKRKNLLNNNLTISGLPLAAALCKGEVRPEGVWAFGSDP